GAGGGPLREVAVQVHAVGVVTPRVGATAAVAHVAVPVHVRDDPDVHVVDIAGDARVGAVVRQQVVDEVEGHLHAHRLIAVHGALVIHLRLILVHAGVVGDFQRPDVAVLNRLAQADQPREVRVRAGERLKVGRGAGV